MAKHSGPARQVTVEQNKRCDACVRDGLPNCTSAIQSIAASGLYGHACMQEQCARGRYGVCKHNGAVLPAVDKASKPAATEFQQLTENEVRRGALTIPAATSAPPPPTSAFWIGYGVGMSMGGNVDPGFAAPYAGVSDFGSSFGAPDAGISDFSRTPAIHCSENAPKPAELPPVAFNVDRFDLAMTQMRAYCHFRTYDHAMDRFMVDMVKPALIVRYDWEGQSSELHREATCSDAIKAWWRKEFQQCRPGNGWQDKLATLLSEAKALKSVEAKKVLAEELLLFVCPRKEGESFGVRLPQAPNSLELFVEAVFSLHEA